MAKDNTVINYGLYNLLRKIFRFDTRFRFYEVDFSKPWWTNFLKYPAAFGFVLISEVAQGVFSAFTPVFIGLIISQMNMDYLLWFFVGYIVLECINRISMYIYTTAFASVQGSIINSAYTYFLTVDPVFHSTKSSGTIQSKVQSAGREFSRMIDIFLFQLLPIFTSFGAVVIALLAISSDVGLIAMISFAVLLIVSIFGNRYISNSLVKISIMHRDKFVAITTENLFQNSIIRSSFATPEQIQLTNSKSIKALESRLIMNMGYSVITFITRMIYITTLITMIYLLLQKIRNGSIDAAIAIGILITYINSTQTINRIGNLVSSYTESSTNMNDLWEYIKNFGTQTYQVVPIEPSLQKQK